jgi:hypothetical protein
MKVPALKDVLQEKKKLTIPEIRVWVHPERRGQTGSDWYQTFDSFKDALEFIRNTKGAETFPLIAYGGYELNIFQMQPEEAAKK